MSSQGSKPPPIGATPFAWRDPASFPRRRWLYGRHLVRRFVSATFAQGGIGKSSLLLAEAVAMAAGLPLLGREIQEGPLRVWYWNGEDPLEEIERRVAAICLHFGITAEALGGRLFLNSGRDCEIIVGRLEKGSTIIAQPVISALTAAISAERIDVAVFDPFVSTHLVGENDNGAVAAVCKALAGVADATDCAIELVHHVRKTGGAEVTVEDGRGASSLLSAARSVRVLNAMTKDEAETAGVKAPRSYFRSENGKANLAPPPEKAEWYRLVPIALGNGDHPDYDNGDQVAVVTPWQWPDTMAKVTVEHLRTIQTLVAADRWRENHQSKQWVGHAVAKVLGLDVANKGDKRRILAMLKTWIAAGMFVVVEGLDERRNTRSFVEVGEWASD